MTLNLFGFSTSTTHGFGPKKSELPWSPKHQKSWFPCSQNTLKFTPFVYTPNLTIFLLAFHLSKCTAMMEKGGEKLLNSPLLSQPKTEGFKGDFGLDFCLIFLSSSLFFLSPFWLKKCIGFGWRMGCRMLVRGRKRCVEILGTKIPRNSNLSRGNLRLAFPM